MTLGNFLNINHTFKTYIQIENGNTTIYITVDLFADNYAEKIEEADQYKNAIVDFIDATKTGDMIVFAKL